MINPYTYRGYRYDNETALYYLNSRYYDANIGRFINADGLLGQKGNILGHNMYAYTQNNPVMYTDSTGYAPNWWNKETIFEVSLWINNPFLMWMRDDYNNIQSGGSYIYS